MADFYEKFSLTESERGIELTVQDFERADEFEDFVAEKTEIEIAFFRPIADGTIYTFDKSTTQEISALIERFKQAVPFVATSNDL